MASPIPGGVNQALQTVKTATQNQQATQQQKVGQSKFDQALASKAGAVQQATAPQAPDAVRQAQQVTKTAEAGKMRGLKIDWNRLENKTIDPVKAKQESSKALNAVAKFLSEVEKGQNSMDKIIQSSLSTKKMSPQELLGMQAMIYRYSQEMELTSKVVEKATTGLKDTLRTQV